MILKWLVSAWVLLTFTTLAQAQEPNSEPTCESSYRQAYLDYTPSIWPNARLRRTYEIYTIYFDFTNHLAVAYDEAQFLFKSLGIDEARQTKVLVELARQMDSGELCNANQAIPDIRAKLLKGLQAASP